MGTRARTHIRTCACVGARVCVYMIDFEISGEVSSLIILAAVQKWNGLMDNVPNIVAALLLHFVQQMKVPVAFLLFSAFINPIPPHQIAYSFSSGRRRIGGSS
ncbi:hypothetical protein EVAR_40599_1 [Eumeta japonica]|uniref:Uncharacterized protein n=1 Tax=Eumeta variegata TaxID=151549 RepID=A0A4C1XIM4_EUMVA|nr:hypothetical protein EVAR_40599_1 [Eumeta japonica]